MKRKTINITVDLPKDIGVKLKKIVSIKKTSLNFTINSLIVNYIEENLDILNKNKNMYNKDKIIRFTAAVPVEIADKLKKIAEAEDRPVSYLINKMVKTYCDMYDLNDNDEEVKNK